MSSQPPPRRKPKGRPLPADDAALDRAAEVGPQDVPDARSWWARGQRPGSPLAELLDATEDDDGLP